MDIADLRIRIDSTAARVAALELDRFQRASKRTGDAAEDLGRRTKAASSAAHMLRTAFAGVSIGLVIRAFINATDTIRNVDSQLKNATRSTRELSEAQRELFEIAQRTRQGYAGLATTFAQIRMTAGTRLGTQDQQLKFFETLSKAVALSGASEQAAASAMVQLRQGLAAGALRGEEFNSVMEQTSRVMYAVADGLGISIGELRKMASEGQLTAEKMREGLTNSAQQIDQEFKNLAPTFGASMTQMGNSVTALIARFEKATGGPLLEFSSMLSGIARQIDKILRDKPLAERLDEAQGRLREAEKPGLLARLGIGRQSVDEAKAELDRLREESRRAFRELENASAQVGADDENRRLDSAAQSWAALARQYRSAGEKADEARRQIVEAGKAAGKSDAEIAKLVARASAKSTGTGGGRADDQLKDFIRDLERAAEERERFEEFLGRVLHDDSETIRRQIADEAEANRRRSDAIRDMIDPARRLRLELEEIAKLQSLGVGQGGLSEEEANIRRFQLGNELDGLMAGDLPKRVDDIKDSVRDLGFTFQSAFEDAIVGGKKLSAVLRGLGQDLMRMFIRKSITEPLANWAAQNFSGLSMRAAGGPVSAGMPYVVGEKGPELFVPRAGGQIVPNGQFGGMTVAPQITIHGEMSRSQEARLAVMMRNVAIATMADSRRRSLA